MSRTIRRLACLALALFAVQASAVELHLATDRQILDELARRLRNGGGGGGSPYEEAVASFTCDVYGNLKVSLIGSTDAGDVGLFVGNQTSCRNQANPLATRFHRINRLTLVHVCDAYGNLKRLALRPSGQIQEIDSSNNGNYTTCLQNAQAQNNRP